MKSAGPRRIRPRDWGVRTKAAIIVAVPLFVLSGFGGVQIADEIDRTSHSAALAEQLSVLPAIMRYSMSVAAAVGVPVFGLPVGDDDAIFDDHTASIEALAAREDLDPVVADDLSGMLAEGRELSSAAATPSANLPALIEQLHRFGLQVQHTVRALIDQTGNTAVFDEAQRLLDLWNAGLLSFDQAAAFTGSIEDSNTARGLLDTAFGSERAALAALRGADEDQQTIAELRAAADRRHNLLLSPITSATRAPDLAALLLTGVAAANDLIDTSVGRIVVELNAERDAAQAAAIRTAVLVALAVACAVAVTLVLAGMLVSSLRRLRDDTTRAAYHDLPSAVAAIRGDTDPATVTIDPIGVDTAEEIGQVARAVDGVNSRALLLAAEQATLRRQITTMLETLARRNRSLVDRQLALIETLEYKERDPQRLHNLFELDHLAARMRRTGESLLVLAGTRGRRTSRSDTPLADVMRAAVSQVEHYERVRLGAVPPVTLIGRVVDDLIHLLTELLDNSLRASGPTTSVVFLVSPAVENGLLLDIIDRGIGIPPAELDQINQRIAEGAEADVHATRHMGLYVVGRVAQRHGLQVRLRPTIDTDTAGGITAGVYLPATLVVGSGTDVTWSTVEWPRRLPDADRIGSAPRHGDLVQ